MTDKVVSVRTTQRVGVRGTPIRQTTVSTAGPQGPPGTPGASGGSYRHVQGAPASTWDIVHDLGYRPNVTAFDSSGAIAEGEIAHLNANHLTITFAAAGLPVSFAGEAELS